MIEPFVVLSILVFGVLCDVVNGVLKHEVLVKHTSGVFLETGSYLGDGIQCALDCGFNTIYSIELSSLYHDFCSRKFEGNNRVNLVMGDSASQLGLVMSKISEPATIWLDGHFSGGQTAKGDSNTPLLQELQSIKNHSVKNHIIMIDDIRQEGLPHFDYVTLDTLKAKILEINPKYRFYLEDGYVINDILVAKVDDNIEMFSYSIGGRIGTFKFDINQALSHRDFLKFAYKHCIEQANNYTFCSFEITSQAYKLLLSKINDYTKLYRIQLNAAYTQFLKLHNDVKALAIESKQRAQRLKIWNLENNSINDSNDNSGDSNNKWTNFTSIYVINLKSRQDRWKQFKHHWLQEAKLPLNNKMYRVEGLELPFNGAGGCAYSHLITLIHLLFHTNDLIEYGMIFEDDFQFIKHAQALHYINDIYSNLAQAFDVFLLFYNIAYRKIYESNSNYIHSNIVRVSRSWSPAGYLITKEYAFYLMLSYYESYKTLTAMELGETFTVSQLEQLQLLKPLFAIDQHWSSLLIQDRWLSYRYPIAIQASGYSNIESSFQNYTYSYMLSQTYIILPKPNLVSARIIGGLGNQLFVIATTLGYAYQHHYDYTFNLTEQFSSGSVLRTTYWNTLLKNLAIPRHYQEFIDHSFVTYKEPNQDKYGLIPKFENSNVLLDGYFQNYLYFDHLYNDLRYSFRHACSEEDMQVVNALMSDFHEIANGRKMIFIHVRRGEDYTDSPVHFGMPHEYYYEAIDYFNRLYTHSDDSVYDSARHKLLFVVFSNDINYAKSMLNHLDNVAFVMDNVSDYISLLLMSLMDGGIIANSSFSWWGAYLADKNKDMTIIVPRCWFKDRVDVKGRRLPHWIALDHGC